ncbi:DUF5801 repeats-in-toxin domain-containing protein, partial [Halomonas salipaludis]
TGSTPDGEVLRIEIGSDGTVTVTQSAPLDHDAQGADSLTLPAGLVGVEATVTVTDGDGDTVSDTLSTDLSGNISIVDDVPGLDTDTTELETLSVDESAFGEPATTSFAGAFDIDFGADGEGSVSYALSVDGSGATGLTATASGEAISLVDNGGVIEGLTASGELAFTISVDSQSGEVTLTQLLALSHPDGSDPADVLDLTGSGLQLSATATDGDGDSTTAAIDLGDRLSFIDDGPSSFLADTAQLEDGFTGSINFADAAGADGVGNVIFTIEEGTPATDLNGNQLLLNGEALTYSYEGGDQSVLFAKTESGEVGFKITLDPAGDSFNVEVFGNILNGTEFTTTIGGGVGGSNSTVYGLNIDDGIENNDVLISTSAGDKVNNSTGNGIGISGGQSIGNGEVARFDFVKGLDIGGSGGNAGRSASWDSNNSISSFAQAVAINGSPGSTTALEIHAFSSVTATSIAQNGGIAGTSAGGTPIALSLEDIRVFDENGADVTSQMSISLSGDGVRIEGLQDGYTFQVTSDTPFEALEITGGGGANFTLGDFSMIEGGLSSDIELNLPLQGIDGDGDAAEGALNVGAPEPDQLFVGGNGDNTFESDGGDDLLIGDIGGKNLIIQPGQNYNISLIVDVSGSMSNASGTPGLSLMELTKQSLINLANQLEQHDGVVNVQLVPFSTHAETAVTIQNLDSDNVQQLIDAIDSLSADGGTNFMAAFQQAVAWFNGQNGQGQDDFENLTYFLTDGDPTYSYYNDQLYGPGTEPTYWVMQDSLQAFSELAGLSAVNAVGIGSDVSEQYLQYFTTNGVEGDANIFMDGKVSWGYANGMYRQFDWGEGEISAPAGSVSIVHTAEDLDSALEGGVEYDELDELGDDILRGGDGDDIIFGDTVNTDHLEWTNGETGDHFIAGEHDGLGYVGLVEYLKWEVNQGQAPDDQQIIEYVRDNWQSLADTDRDDGGNNILDGGAGDDILIGGSGDDLLIGGAGNDILAGGAGDDVFKWNFGDQGDADTPAHDIVTDFGNGQNTLDIADLLQDESEATIGQFVFAEQEGSDTVLYISSDGSLAGSKENADQTIRLEGKSFSDFGASPGDSADLIAKMIENGQLHIDQ